MLREGRQGPSISTRQFDPSTSHLPFLPCRHAASPRQLGQVNPTVVLVPSSGKPLGFESINAATGLSAVRGVVTFGHAVHRSCTECVCEILRRKCGMRTCPCDCLSPSSFFPISMSWCMDVSLYPRGSARATAMCAFHSAMSANSHTTLTASADHQPSY